MMKITSFRSEDQEYRRIGNLRVEPKGAGGQWYFKRVEGTTPGQTVFTVTPPILSRRKYITDFLGEPKKAESPLKKLR